MRMGEKYALRVRLHSMHIVKWMQMCPWMIHPLFFLSHFTSFFSTYFRVSVNRHIHHFTCYSAYCVECSRLLLFLRTFTYCVARLVCLSVYFDLIADNQFHFSGFCLIFRWNTRKGHLYHNLNRSIWNRKHVDLSSLVDSRIKSIL